MASIHPYAVHFPIALIVLWPLIDAAGLAVRRPDVSATAVALLLVAVPATLLASVSGQSAYDAALEVGASTGVLDTHADDANLMPWAILLIAIVRLFALVRRARRVQVLSI